MSTKETCSTLNEISIFNCSENEDSFNTSLSQQVESNSSHDTKTSGQEMDSHMAEKDHDSKSERNTIKLFNGL